MMTMIRELTPVCREYWKLHARARKADGVPEPETLNQINECWEQMTEFEREYVTWINSLYAKKISISEIKRQIKILAHCLKKECVELTEQESEDLQSCKPKKINHRWWSKEKRYTQLCALRAAMRGRLHFSPHSNLDQLWGCYQIGSRDADLNYAPIDLGVQKAWIEEVAAEFMS